MLKHLVLSVVSFFHHRHPVVKPELNIQSLDRVTQQLITADPAKLVCVYPTTEVK